MNVEIKVKEWSSMKLLESSDVFDRKGKDKNAGCILSGYIDVIETIK